MNMDNESLNDNVLEQIDFSKLDPELMKQLEALGDLDTNIDEFFQTKDPSEFSDQQEAQKLIQCAHEIIFTVTAHVMTENEKGEITGSKEICTKNYHIPVPINKEYKSYMNVFFDHLENNIIKTIDTTNEKSEEKPDE